MPVRQIRTALVHGSIRDFVNHLSQSIFLDPPTGASSAGRFAWLHVEQLVREVKVDDPARA